MELLLLLNLLSLVFACVLLFMSYKEYKYMIEYRTETITFVVLYFLSSFLYIITAIYLFNFYNS